MDETTTARLLVPTSVALNTTSPDLTQKEHIHTAKRDLLREKNWSYCIEEGSRRRRHLAAAAAA